MPRYIDVNALMRSTDKEYIHKYEIALAPTVDASFLDSPVGAGSQLFVWPAK